MTGPVTTSVEDASEIDPALQKLIDSAPAHIWLDLGEETHLVDEGTTFRDLAGVTWSEDNATGVGIKYVRAPSPVTTSDAERASLLPCPFCGASASGYGIDPHTHALRLGDFQMPDHPGSYIIEGDCSCGSGLIGATQEEVTARWNSRAHPTALRIDFKQATEQGGWQPIATAPKDGTRILIWQAGFWQTARWQDKATGAEAHWPVGWRTSLYVYPNVEWWAPLPPEPALFLGLADGDAVGGKSGGAA